MDLNDDRKKAFKIFKRFLKEHNVYTVFFKTLRDDNDPNDWFNTYCGHNMNEFFRKCNPAEWTTYCFAWSKQKEGPEFWETLHTLWCSYYLAEACWLI